MAVRVEQARAAVDVQQRMNTDMIQHPDQVVAHSAGETASLFGGLFGVFEGGALAQLLAGFIQGEASLL
ncbi:hypothetical protein D3C80_2173420 [compost metagenome]